MTSVLTAKELVVLTSIQRHLDVINIRTNISKIINLFWNFKTIFIKHIIAEIWADLNGDGKGYDKHGVSSQCIDADYNPITGAAQKNPTSCGLWAGKSETNYVYKITKYETTEQKEGCPYFQSRGCWADIKPWFKKMDARPMEVYALNERDPYASNWNKKLINWGKWGQGYLAGLLCRCAEKAKEQGKKYFSIQFYGKNSIIELWKVFGIFSKFESQFGVFLSSEEWKLFNETGQKPHFNNFMIKVIINMVAGPLTRKENTSRGHSRRPRVLLRCRRLGVLRIGLSDICIPAREY